MDSYKNLIVAKEAHITWVTKSRPERRNAIDRATSAELRSAFETFRDDDDAWIAILTGAEDKSFSAGADLDALSRELAAEGNRKQNVPFGGITRNFQCWKPMIAAINGFCLAGGMELALACDIRIAAQHTTFGLPEPKRAIIPAAGGTQRLPRSVPLAFAMEALLTGERFDADTALRFGLVSRVVAADRLIDTVREIAGKILECGPLAVRAIKQAVMEGRELTLSEGLKLEARLSSHNFQTEDALEGPRAFAEKREPVYKGR